MRLIRLLVGLLSCFAIFAVNGCSNAPTGNSSQTANANVKPSPAAAANSTAPASPATSPPMAGGGDPIDTSKYDEEIAQAEKKLEKKPDDAGARTALAHAYLKRAGALTKARQYRTALGDYRRTLKYEPENEEALNMTSTIIGIMKQMGREVPAEGTEPPPLPMKKEGDKSGLALPKKNF